MVFKIHHKETKTLNMQSISTYQYIRRGFRDSGQHVHTLRGEVAPFTRPRTLSVTPARVHHNLAVVLLQDDEVTLLEAQE